ncbi:MAG: hypothetical protein ACK514_18505 [Bacteroidota bacterium]|jgi:hypothetical protein|nr:hypothetical protein [Cytophagales bacterium]MCE2956311.1 hypothetical protein [Flammeovirgaceae bacterium]MCZ8070568.1 hypothetical protein [Cytophagales bacterium]
MELKEFIKETIKQIALGVSEAQLELKETGAIINPSGMSVGDKGDKYLRHDGWRYVQDVEINVAISLTDKEDNKGGLGVVAGLFNAGMVNSSEASNSKVSTIKFNIPIALPIMPTPTEYKVKGWKAV